MTLLTLRADVRERLGVPSDDSLYTDTVVTGLINDALNFVSTEADWWWLEKSETIAMSASTSAYTVASDCTRTIAVVDAVGVPLSRRGIDELGLMTTAESANVRFFASYGTKIEVRPVPNGTFNLTHRYIGGETALSGDSDVPLIPAQFQPFVVEYATYLARMRAGNSTEAKANLEVYMRWIDTLKARGSKTSDSKGGGGIAGPAAGAA